MPDWNYHGLCPELLRAVNDMGWLLPTPIQDEALPAILGGGDVCGAAETGSGKTAAFVLPILQQVQETMCTHATAANGGETKRGPPEKKAEQLPPATLSIEDRDSLFAVQAPTHLTCQSRQERQWCGGRATVGVRGRIKVYYEAHCDDEGLCRVGWSTSAANFNLGTDAYGFGFGGTGKKSNRRKFIDYGRAFSHGDVIGCLLDTQQRTIEFSINGKRFGTAFKLSPEQLKSPLFPAVVLKNAQMTFNFGGSPAEPLRFMPDGYIALANCPSDVLARGLTGAGAGGAGAGAVNADAHPMALILAPTRDLAEQINKVVQDLCKYITSPPIHAALVVGGGVKTANLRRASIVCGTLGRVQDMIRRRKLAVDGIRFFVLDEADQMAADKESRKAVVDIYRSMPKETANGYPLQVCFFSATLHSPEAQHLAEEITHHATWVDLKGKDVVPDTVHHVVVPIRTASPDAPWGASSPLDKFTDAVHAQDPKPSQRAKATGLMKSQVIKRMKLEMLRRIIDQFQMGTCMIFCRTNLDCDNLERYLCDIGQGRVYSGKRESGKENPYSCVVVAGKRRQQERRENLAAFRDGDVRFLICTDVAARGIDLTELPFVINMTLPDAAAQYYHRIGRVGRAGCMGLAISLVADQEPEKVWYHANCKKRGSDCRNTKLLSQRGCCTMYTEPKFLQAIEAKLEEPIARVSADLGLPEGMKIEDYGERKQEGPAKTSARIASIRPAVDELCQLEIQVQGLWLQSLALSQQLA